MESTVNRWMLFLEKKKKSTFYLSIHLFRTVYLKNKMMQCTYVTVVADGKWRVAAKGATHSDIICYF